MATCYGFRFISTYQGEPDYSATVDGAEVRLRVKTVDGIRTVCRPGGVITAELVAAFNAWRAAEYAEAVATLSARGYAVDKMDPLEVCRGGYWTPGGWQFLPPA